MIMVYMGYVGFRGSSGFHVAGAGAMSQAVCISAGCANTSPNP